MPTVKKPLSNIQDKCCSFTTTNPGKRNLETQILVCLWAFVHLPIDFGVPHSLSPSRTLCYLLNFNKYQGGLNEIELNPCNIFSIFIFSELYLFV